MPEERFLTIQLHELLMYSGQRSVATILIGAHQGLIGSQMNTPVDASYLADAVILMRYFEARGEVRQAISVMKKRGSKHERTIREFRLDDGRITVGEALRDFRGILTGVPVYEGHRSPCRRREAAVIESDAAARDGRVLVLAPTSKDASITQVAAVVQPAFPIEICADVRRPGRGTASGRRRDPRFPKKRCRQRTTRRCASILAAQPPWSDLPVLVLTRSGRRFRRARRSGPDARQRDAARAAGARRRRCSARSARPFVRASASIRSAGISRSGRAPRNRCASPISARTSSSRRSVTSCAIRWRRC